MAGAGHASVLLLSWAALGSACSRHPVEASAEDASSHAPAASTVRPDASPPRAETAPDPVDARSRAPAEDGLQYETASVESGKSIGHTSVVFKLKMKGGLEAAYKPRSKRGHDRYKGEVAAFRLARALGLRNVPLAIPRSFDLATLTRAVGAGSPGGLLLTDEAVPDADGQIAGALIPWLPELGFPPLEQTTAEWRPWLDRGSVPEDKRGVAADISRMMAFDYVTANWDRWSGGNIGVDRKTGRLLFIDNDAAFFDPPPPGPLRSMREKLVSTTRFSRTLVERLRALTDEKVSAAVGDERPGHPLLKPWVVSGVAARAREVVGIVDAVIAKRGADEALFFE